MHLDVASSDPTADVDRLVALGARRVGPPSSDTVLVVLQDPEGNEFCVVRR